MHRFEFFKRTLYKTVHASIFWGEPMTGKTSDPCYVLPDSYDNYTGLKHASTQNSSRNLLPSEVGGNSVDRHLTFYVFFIFLWILKSPFIRLERGGHSPTWVSFLF